MAWRNLPNAITLGRIVLAAVVAPMLMTDHSGWRIAAFIVFLAAAFSDLWDGHLARSRNLVSDFGKLMDPLADKLLLGLTFVPFYVLNHYTERETPFPWLGWTFPLWIVLVIFGREAFITVFRGFAARRNVILAAGKAGKLKAVFQNIFIGAAILWYALQSKARADGWPDVGFGLAHSGHHTDSRRQIEEEPLVYQPLGRIAPRGAIRSAASERPPMQAVVTWIAPFGAGRAGLAGSLEAKVAGIAIAPRGAIDPPGL